MKLLRQQTLARHLLVAVVLALVLFGLTEVLSDYWLTLLSDIAYFTCAAIGLTMLTGWSGQLSLGQGAFVAVGAYTVALILEHHVTSNFGLIWVLIAAVIVTGIIGAVVGIAAARLRGPYLAGLTLALALGLPVLPDWSKLSGKLGGHAGISVDVPAAPGTEDFQRWIAWICCLAAVILIFLVANLGRSRVGRAMRAVRDDEVSASLAGLNVARVQVLAFIASAACAGLGGGLFALVALSVGPNSFPLPLSLSLLAAVVIGGLGSLAGAVYGSALVILLQQVWASDISNAFSFPVKVSNNLPQLIFGGALVLATLFVPLGIQGTLRKLWTALPFGNGLNTPAETVVHGS